MYTHSHFRRNEILLFLAFTFGLSAIFYYRIITAGILLTHNSFDVLLLMWCPGLAAILTRLLMHGDLHGLGWRLGKGKYLLWAYLLPVVYGSTVYGIAWSTGLAAFDREMLDNFTYFNEREISTLPAMLAFIGLGTLHFGLTAFGAELGWRGFLVPGLYKYNTFLGTSLISGLIWSVWYAPLILFADHHSGAHPLFGLCCFFLLTTGMSFAFAWLRLKSCSVWPPVLLHAAHNLYIQGFFDRVTADTGITAYVTTEFGIGLALAATVVALFFYTRRDQIYRDPEALPVEEPDDQIIIPSRIE